VSILTAFTNSTNKPVFFVLPPEAVAVAALVAGESRHGVDGLKSRCLDDFSKIDTATRKYSAAPRKKNTPEKENSEKNGGERERKG